MPTMLTLKAAAEQTGLSYSCLRRWILDGTFPYYVKVGSKYLLNKERLADFLNSPARDSEQPATVAGMHR